MKLKSKITIRKARPSDALGLTKVYYKTWLAAYPNEKLGITIDDIKAKFKGRFSVIGLKKQRERIRLINKNKNQLVAIYNGRIIGLCNSEINEKYNELKVIYILPTYQRLGIGQKLWQKSLKFFDPQKDIIVKLADYNIQAQNFYKKLGFRDTGKRLQEDIGRFKSGAAMTEIVMRIKHKK